MRIGALAAMVFALLIGLPIASMADPAVAGLAPDTDLTLYPGPPTTVGPGPDGVPDVLDNCDRVHNDAPEDCDTDGDGLGNMCDCDFNNDNVCNVADFNLFKANFGVATTATGPQYNMNCNVGTVNAADFNQFKIGFQNSPPLAAPGNLSGCLNGTAGC